MYIYIYIYVSNLLSKNESKTQFIQAVKGTCTYKKSTSCKVSKRNLTKTYSKTN